MSVTEGNPIPILDLKPEIEALWPQLNEKLKEVLFSGQFILGPETRSFEAEAAEWLGSKHAIGVNSGTDALMIGMRAAGIGPGDEVITTPFSFFATAESISSIGAKPIFVDVDLDSMNIDPDQIEAAITEKTKAIMPVHLFGRPCAMNRIMALAEKRGLKVIEDCAQSFGARYEGCPGCGIAACSSSRHIGRMTGAIGAVGCFSFFPTKNLGCYGDGGLIVTDDDMVADECRKLRTHGSVIRYRNESLGYNSRLDSLQAAILRIKLPLVAEYNEARRSAAEIYGELLAGLPGVIAPDLAPGHVFHQYTIRVTDGNRDAAAAKMAELGVNSMVYYPIPQDRLPVYAGQYPTYEKSEILSRQVLSLPIWPQIDRATQERVAAALRTALAR
jgi:dTDP-4-amino-4,6-dideoxygalactose transaminase